jgi:carbonic anhydrase
MSFCTVINCMDGRVQLPVIEYLQTRFRVDYVDSITEAGPNGILARGAPAETLRSMFERVRISVEHHTSVGIAVVGHHDCAGNPVERPQQLEDTRAARRVVREQFGDLPVLGLWVDERWDVHEVDED